MATARTPTRPFDPVTTGRRWARSPAPTTNRKKAAVLSVAPPMMPHDTRTPSPWNRMSEPSTIDTIPPAASRPWLATLISAMKNPTASTISAIPA